MRENLLLSSSPVGARSASRPDPFFCLDLDRRAGMAGLVILGLLIWGLSSLLGVGKPTPTPEIRVDVLLTAEAETQQAMQNLLASTQTALAQDREAQTAAAQVAATLTSIAISAQTETAAAKITATRLTGLPTLKACRWR